MLDRCIQLFLSVCADVSVDTKELDGMIGSIASEIDIGNASSEFYSDIFDIVRYGALSLHSDDAQWASWAAQRSYDIAFELAQRAMGSGLFSEAFSSIEGHYLVQNELSEQRAELKKLSGTN